MLTFALPPLAVDAAIVKRPFGRTAQGKPVELYTLTNKNGVEAAITNYGGIVVSLKTPDRQGQMADVVPGFDSLDDYLKVHSYFGAIVGRYGNRIANGRFALDGKTYKLATNNGPNALHGGLVGFDKVVWTARQSPPASLELTYTSLDGEEGYPGTLNAKVTYTLTDANELKIAYEATTDKPTVVNLTNHSYFNLAGQGRGDILKHQIRINASRFTPVDATLIPTGELRPVKGTPFDFITPHAIGERIGQTGDEQIRFGGGYDHNFVLNSSRGALALAASAYSSKWVMVFEKNPGQRDQRRTFLPFHGSSDIVVPH